MRLLFWLCSTALRNIGFVESSEGVVRSCYSEPTNAMEVRLAAIDLAKTLVCRAEDESDMARRREPLAGLFSDASADSEIRIGAYMALMGCPDEDTVRMVKDLLEKEEVNQGARGTSSLAIIQFFLKKNISTFSWLFRVDPPYERARIPQP